MSNPPKLATQLQGITRIVADATIGVTDLVEAMHKRVVHPPLLPSTPIQHLITFIAGITYKNIRFRSSPHHGRKVRDLGLVLQFEWGN